MNLTNDDVRDILELLDSLPYGELRLRTGSFALTLRRTAGGTWTQETQVLSPPQAMDAEIRGPDGGGETGPTEAAARNGPVSAGQASELAAAGAEGVRAASEVRAPLPGTFYRAPRPGAASYVEVGDDVDEDTVVGIVETMKLMNPVYAGVRGRIADICLADAQFAEQDAVLVRVDLAAT